MLIFCEVIVVDFLCIGVIGCDLFGFIFFWILFLVYLYYFVYIDVVMEEVEWRVVCNIRWIKDGKKIYVVVDKLEDGSE